MMTTREECSEPIQINTLLRLSPYITVVLVALCSCSIMVTGDDEFLRRAEDMISELVMEQHQLEAVPNVVADVERALRTRWPDCQVKLFGSVSDGVATRDSDVDVTVLLLGGNTLPDVRLVTLAAATLSQHPQFTNFRIPKNVKVNIVKCIHVPSGLPIDISFGRLTNVRSSSVIRYFMNDSRAYRMMMLFKRWAKLHGNYNLYPLVIFYLQQENILPPVSLLQRNAKPHFVGEWNTGFETVELKAKNTKSLYQLLGGFFEYYTKFEYEKHVISIFAGYPVEKTQFAKLELPEEFTLYKWNIRQNVSKPLDLRHKFTLHRFFDLNVREGDILLEPFAYSAMVFKMYNSTEFFDILFFNAMYCVNEPFGSVLFNHSKLKGGFSRRFS